MSKIRYPNIKVKLTGQNGNAFNLMGICQHAARENGVPEEEIKEFIRQCKSGDYDNLIRTCHEWFKVR